MGAQLADSINKPHYSKLPNYNSKWSNRRLNYDKTTTAKIIMLIYKNQSWKIIWRQTLAGTQIDVFDKNVNKKKKNYNRANKRIVGERTKKKKNTLKVSNGYATTWLANIIPVPTTSNKYWTVEKEHWKLTLVINVQLFLKIKGLFTNIKLTVKFDCCSIYLTICFYPCHPEHW